jgi:hypothetical protein
MLTVIVRGSEIFTGLELSRLSLHLGGGGYSVEEIHQVGLFHGINSPEGIFCGSNFLIGWGGVFAGHISHGLSDFRYYFKSN